MAYATHVQAASGDRRRMAVVTSRSDLMPVIGTCRSFRIRTRVPPESVRVQIRTGALVGDLLEGLVELSDRTEL